MFIIVGRFGYPRFGTSAYHINVGEGDRVLNTWEFNVQLL